MFKFEEGGKAEVVCATGTIALCNINQHLHQSVIIAAPRRNRDLNLKQAIL
jgi:hypothetical protein